MTALVGALGGCSDGLSEFDGNGSSGLSGDPSGPGSTGAPSGSLDSSGEGPPDASTTSAVDDSTGDGASAAVALRLFNVTMDVADPRWDVLPASLSTVQVPAAYTLQAQVPDPVASVRFVLDGQPPVLDVVPPFRLSEGAGGEAESLELSVGAHVLQVEAFASADGSGAPLESVEESFELTRAGTLEQPAEHTIHRLWRTESGDYLHRNDAGDFLDADGVVVISGEDVSVVQMGEDQGHLVVAGGAEIIEFAFIVLLPDGFDPAVPYPLVVFLHHGWHVYRGTDNDGLPLDAPLLGGSRSLTQAPEQRSRFVSIVLVPQMRQTQEIDGFIHEWGTHTDLSNEAGTLVAGPEVSVNTQPVLDVIERLEQGSLVIDGQAPVVDPARIYLTGHSMGGLGTWDLLGRMPDRWAAAVPMAGFADHSTAADLVDTPIWAFHHEIDCYNTVVGTETMYELITETHGGARMNFTRQTFDTAGACDQAHFQTPQVAWGEQSGLFEWIFGQVNDRL
ncbi:MAG: prolyl oligopeptidase family serine peptidase [Myxococcota bacterium]